MARQIPNNDGTLEWTEKFTDKDGDFVDISVELEAVDDGAGFTTVQQDSSNVSWLSFDVIERSPQPDFSRDYTIKIFADTSGLQAGFTYRFNLTADDSSNSVSRLVTLTVNSS